MNLKHKRIFKLKNAFKKLRIEKLIKIIDLTIKLIYLAIYILQIY